MEGADGEVLAALGDKALLEFSQGEVGCLLDGVDEEIGLRFHACGAPVAATRFGVCASGAEIGLHPPDGAGGVDAESFGCGGA